MARRFAVNTMGRFTNAPLPSLKLLGKSLIKSIKPYDRFLDPWRRYNHLTFPLSRSAWSFRLIANYKLIQSNSSSLSILVPSYFCNSTLAPLREMEVNLVFYPIKEDGRPDIDEVNKILLKKKIDIIIGVHFFGSFTDFTDLSFIAKHNNIWFVEDFAHLLNFPDKNIIESDFQLFSPHKFLPIPDGALLSVNKSIFKNEVEEKDFTELYKLLTLKGSSHSKAIFWLFKRLMQKLNLGIKVGIRDYYNDRQIITSKSFFRPRMTNMSKRILSVLVKDLEKNKHSRQENAQAWKSLVLSRFASAEVLFIKEIEKRAESIYLLGFIFSDSLELEEALSWCNLKEFPVTTWPDLPKEVLEDHDYFEESIRIRNNSIFFQVHSSIDKKNIESYLKA